MSLKLKASTVADEITDIALHEELKCRAYVLYEKRDILDGHDLKNALQSELPRVVYAAALQKYAKGELGETRAVRAARVYLSALSTFLRDPDRTSGVTQRKRTVHPDINL